MKPQESFVGQPVCSLQTMLRVISEYDRRETTQAVTAFQRKYGLPMTGVTDQATWERIVEVYDVSFVQIHKAQHIEIVMDPARVYRLGEESAWLYLTQAMLTYLSERHDDIPQPTQAGTLDSLTAQALQGFQALAGLPPTGELDKETWRYLVHHFTLNAVLAESKAFTEKELQ